MYGALTINYESQEELVAITKALAGIGKSFEPLDRLPLAENPLQLTKATASDAKTLTVSAVSSTTTCDTMAHGTAATGTPPAMYDQPKPKAAKKAKPETRKYQTRVKPDPFELKKQGWTVRGPYSMGRAGYDCQCLRLIDPADHGEYLTYRIGDSQRGAPGLTDEQVKALLADTEYTKRGYSKIASSREADGSTLSQSAKASPQEDKPAESADGPFTLESATEHALSYTDKYVNVGQRLAILCADCNAEGKSSFIVKKISNNRFKHQETSIAIQRHNLLTGHTRFRTEIAQEEPLPVTA
jgi:hypothetical protein